jgi:ankyrin repeat protein
MVASNVATAAAILAHPSGAATINTTDLEDATALHMAASLGKSDLVKLLLQHGADPGSWLVFIIAIALANQTCPRPRRYAAGSKVWQEDGP